MKKKRIGKNPEKVKMIDNGRLIVNSEEKSEDEKM